MAKELARMSTDSIIKECVKFLKKKKEGYIKITIDMDGNVEYERALSISNEQARRKGFFNDYSIIDNNND